LKSKSHYRRHTDHGIFFCKTYIRFISLSGIALTLLFGTLFITKTGQITADSRVLGDQSSTTPTPTPPPGCFYKQGVCPMIACTENNCPPCNPILICPNGTPIPSINPSCLPHPPCANGDCEIPEPADGWCPSPTQQLEISPTCMPRPLCLDAEPKCAIPEPAGGWCKKTNPDATGDAHTHSNNNDQAGGNDDNKQGSQEPSTTSSDNNQQGGQEPSTTASGENVQPTCIPKPKCIDQTGSEHCNFPSPTQGWCAPENKPLSDQQSNSLLDFLNRLLRSLLGIHDDSSNDGGNQ
jgi:hypothetical protein